MRPHWTNINEQDRTVFRAAVVFLSGRLKEKATVDWALRLKPDDTVKRLALLDVLNSSEGNQISEPWRSAWRLIEECWSNPTMEHSHSMAVFEVQNRIQAGDRSGSLIKAIVELIEPHLTVEPFSDITLRFRELPKRPRKVGHLFSTGLSSGKVINPDMLEIGGMTDHSFLISLAFALDAAVANGLSIARRIGWKGGRRLWPLGQLNRAYYVSNTERISGEHEPDEFNTGISPSVKLLHAVVARLIDIDISIATEFIRRWERIDSPIYFRLRASFLHDPRIASANDVSDFLLSLDNSYFWRLSDYPEVAELRSKRFNDLDSDDQVKLTARIRKRPPRNQWPKQVDADEIEKARLYWALRELRRIEIAGASLPTNGKAWLDENINEFPDLAQMDRLDEGFEIISRAHVIAPNPDTRYDSLAGEERLKALESALSSGRISWDNDPGERASDWIRKPGNPILILSDFESSDEAGAAFPRVWKQFGWAHSPVEGQGNDVSMIECSRVLSLLEILPESVLSHAIDGVSHWLSVWEKQIVALPDGFTVWMKLWPIAVEETNSKQSDEDEVDFSTVAQPDSLEPRRLDTLNTPTGKLIGVFLAACPNLEENEHPFEEGTTPRRMRDVIIDSTGRSGLIVRHRMIEGLNYFLSADPEWTREHLITPLINDNIEAIAFWDATARQTHFSKVLKIIGSQMAERAIDRRLSRETRRSLVFSLVIEALYACREQREPVVPRARIQQMIRSLDDEVRAYGAEAIRRFVNDLSRPDEREPNPPSPEDLFRSSAAPFLLHYWPPERSLSTPGVSSALAGLPATVRGSFAEAVDAIEHLLVPFECWSMYEYGLRGKENDEAKLSIIDNREKASALLRLLDLTIGTGEGAVSPHDLADTLEQIRKVAPRLVESREFRRLATSARRG